MSLMLEEIREQPQVLQRTIEAEREKVTQIGDFLRQKDIDLIVLVARGSSDNAALFGRYLLEISTGIPVSLSAALISRSSSISFSTEFIEAPTRIAVPDKNSQSIRIITAPSDP